MIRMLPIVDAVARTSHMARARKRIEEVDEDATNFTTTIGEDVQKFLQKYYRKLRHQARSK